MFKGSHELNNSCVYFENRSYIDDKKQYYNTTIKKKKPVNDRDSKNQNLLINILKNFSVKYELDEKIPKSYKFVLSFDELISLIRFTLESQIKLNKNLKEDSEIINTISQEFINNLNNYIYSYEKVEKISQNTKSKKNVKSPSNKENCSINSNKGRNTKLIRIISKPSSSWIDGKKPKNNQNNQNIKDEYQTHTKNKNFHNPSNSIQTSRSYYRRNNGTKLFSPENNKIKEKIKKNEKTQKKLLNRTTDKRHNSILSDLSSNTNTNDNLTKRKINKSTGKRKSLKMEQNKKENKSLSIYTACENLKSSSFILKTKNREITNIEKCDKKENDKKNNYESNNNIYNETKKEKENKKVIYYNQNMMLGVKKKVIISNMPKPSNLANKLLQNGRKFITEFNGIKEEERKKQFY